MGVDTDGFNIWINGKKVFPRQQEFKVNDEVLYKQEGDTLYISMSPEDVEKWTKQMGEISDLKLPVPNMPGQMLEYKGVKKIESVQTSKGEYLMSIS